MKKLLDTNTLLNGAESGILTYPVLEELDRLKTREGVTGKQARDAVKYIYKNLSNFEFLDVVLKDGQTVDDFLLETAQNFDYILVTYDLSLYLKGISIGIDCDFGLEDEFEYSGVTYLTEEEYFNVGLILEKNLPENHYLIYDKEVYCITNGELERVEPKKIKSYFLGEVAARNPEQVALIDSLFKEIPVVLITGGYGTGMICPFR